MEVDSNDSRFFVNFLSPFRKILRWCLKVSDAYFLPHAFQFIIHSNSLDAARPIPPKLEDHPLSAVRDCLFTIFAATLRIWMPALHPQHEDAPCRGETGSRNININIDISKKRKLWFPVKYSVFITFTYYIQQEPGYLSGKAPGHGLDERGFESWQSLGISFLTAASRLVPGPTHPFIQSVPGAPPLGTKPPGRSSDNSPPSSAEVKEREELLLHSPIRPHGVVLS
jgi:hypothetical protein